MFDCSFYWNKYVVCVCSMIVMIIRLSFSDTFKIHCCANDASMKIVLEPATPDSLSWRGCSLNNTYTVKRPLILDRQGLVHSVEFGMYSNARPIKWCSYTLKKWNYPSYPRNPDIWRSLNPLSITWISETLRRYISQRMTSVFKL